MTRVYHARLYWFCIRVAILINCMLYHCGLFKLVACCLSSNHQNGMSAVVCVFPKCLYVFHFYFPACSVCWTIPLWNDLCSAIKSFMTIHSLVNGTFAKMSSLICYWFNISWICIYVWFDRWKCVTTGCIPYLEYHQLWISSIFVTLISSICSLVLLP